MENGDISTKRGKKLFLQNMMTRSPLLKDSHSYIEWERDNY
jgi:hypothetical protein